MIHELRNLEVARKIFDTPSIHLALEYIIEGKSKSPIYVDDIKNPNKGITWIGNRVFLVGDPHDKTFRTNINMIMSQQYLIAYMVGSSFTAYPDNEEWTQVLKEIFYDASTEIGRREYYALDITEKDWTPNIPNGYEFVEVNKPLIMKPYEKIERLMEEMRSETDSPDDFLEKEHFGIAALKGREVAGYCLTEYNLKDRFEVGIEVLPEHQHKGIATEMTRALFKLALSKGFRYGGWHCWSNNEASMATAQKVGLKKIKDYPACKLSFIAPNL